MIDSVRSALNSLKTAVDTHETDWMAAINTIPALEKSDKSDHFSMVLEKARCNTMLFKHMRDAVKAKVFADRKARQIISNMITQWMIYASLCKPKSPPANLLEIPPDVAELESVSETEIAEQESGVTQPKKKKKKKKKTTQLAVQQKKKKKKKISTPKLHKATKSNKTKITQPARKRKSAQITNTNKHKGKALATVEPEDTTSSLIFMLQDFSKFTQKF